MSILEFHLRINYEFWFSLWTARSRNASVNIECPYPFRCTSTISRVSRKNRILIVVTVSTVCSVCAHSVPHGSSAMRGLAAISVPPMPNTTHDTVKARGKWPDSQWHSGEYPVLYRLIFVLSFFRHLSLSAFYSGRQTNQFVNVCKAEKGWSTDGKRGLMCMECRRKYKQNPTSAASYF